MLCFLFDCLGFSVTEPQILLNLPWFSEGGYLVFLQGQTPRSQTLYSYLPLIYDNLGHLYGIQTLAREQTFSTQVTWEKMCLCKQTDDLQHKSFCSCSLLSIASEISIISWFEKFCQLLSLYADSMQNWNLWRKELITLKKKELLSWVPEQTRQVNNLNLIQSSLTSTNFFPLTSVTSEQSRKGKGW